MKKSRNPDSNYNEFSSVKDQVGVYRYPPPPLPQDAQYNSYYRQYSVRKPIQYNKDPIPPSAMEGRIMNNNPSHPSMPNGSPYIYPPSYPMLQNNSYYCHPQQPEMMNMISNTISPRRDENDKVASTLTSFQNLNPKDAFSYLDLVKLKYKNRPHIYNEFLDVMKDYKANKIDTTGVINSIQRLFESHPELIYAFNTFLPNGYYIGEPQNFEKDPINVGSKNTIITPSTNVDSAQTHSSIDCENKGAFTIPSLIPSIQPTSESSKLEIQSMPNNVSCPPFPKSDPSSFTPQISNNHHSSSTLPNMNLAQNSNLKNAPQNSVESIIRQSFPSNSNIQSSPPQYALDYISKIKARFYKKPEVFQNFLDILGNYQDKQTKVVDGSLESQKLHDEIYAGVSKIFKNEPDLLQEFSLFLPDPPKTVKPPEETQDNDSINKQKRKKKPLGSEEAHPKQFDSTVDFPQPVVPPSNGVVPPIQPVKVNKESKEDEFDDHLHLPLWFTKNNPIKIVEDNDLWNKLRKNLNKRSFMHILRIVSLYNVSHLSQKDALALLSQIVFPHKELYNLISNTFHTGDDKKHNDSNLDHPSSVASSQTFHNFLSRTQFIDFTESRRIGTSYWPFKKNYVPDLSSGRTKLSEETINETYISQPSLSEDTPFNLGKKSIAVETLQKIEQERYDTDMILSTNRAAIEYLEDLHKLATEDNRATFSVDLSITDTSSFKQICCYKAIERIYGDNCNIILEGLKSTCYEVLPLVISRLKSKDKDWVCAHQKINALWSADVNKYSLKALDHQGQNFKSSDAKNTRIKHLLKEITTESNVPTEIFLSNKFDTLKDTFPLEFASKRICLNALHFIYYAIKRLNAVSKNEKAKMYGFLNVFHCGIFSLTPDLSLAKDEEISIDSFTNAFNSLSSKNSIQIYTNLHIYIYLRLYQLLCSRLLKMENIKNDPMNTKYYCNLSFNNKLKIRHTSDDGENGKLLPSAVEAKKSDNCADSTRIEEYHQHFQNLLYNLIDGNIDADSFEEGCICMFGLDCFFLFSIDKIINGIVRQLNTIIIDTPTLNLLNDLPILMKKHSEHFNKLEFLKYWQSIFEEESCFLININKKEDSILLNCKVLDIGVKASTEPSEESANEDWVEYITQFTNIEYQKTSTTSNRNLFLNRNYIDGKKLRKAQEIVTKSIIDINPNNPDNTLYKKSALDPNKIIMSYKLESDIMINSYKIHYVQQTEDILFIKGCFNTARKYFKSSSYSGKISRFKSFWAEKLCSINNSSVH